MAGEWNAGIIWAPLGFAGKSGCYTVDPTGDLLPFKNGIFRMIQSAPVPVLPVTLIDTGRILPKKGFALHSGEVRIIIHPPIMPAEIETMNLEQFRDRVYNTIAGPLPKYS
jgi:1-acyl-sn-glycerol-3-phosphate acyltransferase